MQPIIINQEPRIKTITRTFTSAHKCYKKGDVSYRITFKYKSNFSGDEKNNVTIKNMNFTNFAAPKRGLRA